jgi:hypothetical protein
MTLAMALTGIRVSALHMETRLGALQGDLRRELRATEGVRLDLAEATSPMIVRTKAEAMGMTSAVSGDSVALVKLDVRPVTVARVQRSYGSAQTPFALLVPPAQALQGTGENPANDRDSLFFP